MVSKKTKHKETDQIGGCPRQWEGELGEGGQEIHTLVIK